MRSKNPKDYSILVQNTVTTTYNVDNPKGSQEFSESDKTFWIVSHDGELNRRYSVISCPQWIKKVYEYWTR